MHKNLIKNLTMYLNKFIRCSLIWSAKPLYGGLGIDIKKKSFKYIFILISILLLFF